MGKVRFLFGRSGSGKSYKLCQDMIARSLAMPKQNYFMIVPEQFTMETQKRMAHMHPNGGVMDIDILSFDRLAYRIFEELSVKTDRVLEDIGKTMIIGHLLDMHSDELLIFQSSSKRPGFHDEMKSMICELFQYGIRREDVASAMECLSKDSVLYMKLHDLLLIFDYFITYIEGHYIVAEQQLDLAGTLVSQSKILRDAVIFFDGYTGFTPVQYVMLSRLLDVAADICVAITMPTPKTEFAKEHHLFHMGYEMYSRLISIIEKHKSVELLESENMEMVSDYRHTSSSEIAHLERNIFTFPYRKYEEVPSDIRIFSARTTREEIKEIARRIRGLILQGYRYRDIAVVTGALEETAYLADEIFMQYHIPCFIDQKTDLRKNPFVAWILALWRIVAFRYRRCDVIAYVKSGYSKAVNAARAGQLENYALARNIDSKSGWQLSCKNTYVEGLRQKLMEELSEFEALLQGKQVRDYLRAIYLFSVKLNIEYSLLKQAEEFEEASDYHQAGIYTQIYPKTAMLFDKLVDILGEEELSYTEFYHLLESGVNSLDIGMIPQGLDQVIVGDIMRTRLSDIKVLFLMDANEGIIPHSNTKAMILNDSDREQLSADIGLAPTGRIKGYQEQFYLYLTLTKPSEKLFVSYHKLATDNKGVRPSYIISRLTALFPQLSEEAVTEVPSPDQVYTAEEGISILSAMLQGKLPEDEKILHVLLKQFENTKEEQMMLSGLSYPLKEELLPKELAQALYGERPVASVSRLEKYAGCAYAFFLEYGLKLKEQKLFEIQTTDTGSILHETLKGVFDYFKQKTTGIRLASTEVLMAKTKEIFADIIQRDDYRELFEATNRSQYLYHTLEGVAMQSLSVLKHQLEAGRMIPAECELPFGGKHTSYVSIALSDQVTMDLNGVVDRVDVFVDSDAKKLYVQVIDYKSSNKSIDYTKLYYGKQLQLFVYMNVVKKWAKQNYPDMDIVPIGMYYFHLNNELVDTADIHTSEDELKKLREKNMRLSGLSVEDEHRIALVDNGPGLVLPLIPKKDGGFRANASLVTDTIFEHLCAYALEKVEALGKDMYDGHIEVNPYKYGQETGCTYCPYAGICGFDPTDEGRTYRYLAKKSREECREHEMDAGSAKSN